MIRKMRDPFTGDLFAEQLEVDRGAEVKWPDASRVPLNHPAGHTVERALRRELEAEAHAIVAAGYASLPEMVNLVASRASSKSARSTRILLGHEPFRREHERFRRVHTRFSKEMENYWLERGFSLRLSAPLIKCIEALETGAAEVRCWPDDQRGMLHAKGYLTGSSATFGSSNFTRAGLSLNAELNGRFSKALERERYREAEQVIENYWRMGRDFSKEFLSLLQSLLRVVTWREALARACAELLEGDWAGRYLGGRMLPEEVHLWPSQRQGIAQALYILARQGSVLIADATGSGKTRLGVHLIRAVLNQITASGRYRRGLVAMICPPAVADAWRHEARIADVPMEVISHGILSHARSARGDSKVLDLMRRAQVVCVDEGHNFFNPQSKRTQGILQNMCDHCIVFTATPINRGVSDLVHVADLLGADNLDDEVVDALELLSKTGSSIGLPSFQGELRLVKSGIQKCTVRRTKRMLNVLIDRDPPEYVNEEGRPCRFPEHRSKFYELNEPDSDQEIAIEIRRLSECLHPVTFFQKGVDMPAHIARRGVTEEQYVDWRLRGAKSIARYQVMALLRSSSAALAEHIEGTERAAQKFGLTEFKKSVDTGNAIRTLERISGKPPNSSVDSSLLPRWLTDPEAHEQACAEDIETFCKIIELLGSISDARESSKAKRLVRLVRDHHLLVAFDRSLITLELLKLHLAKIDADLASLIATGDAHSDRTKILELFRGGSGARNVIALCSDSLSEGVNLQESACMVHLDMPSVVRIAEQRAGRVDRMDSAHSQVEIWWPKDAPAFALTSDTRFLERYQAVDAVIGSNFDIPPEILTSESSTVTTEELVSEYERQLIEEPWDGICDAFDPVYGLIGEDRPVPREIYDHYRRVTARILSRVSVVKSHSDWAFFCLAGGPLGAPRWILFPKDSAEPATDLEEISTFLEGRLTDPEVEDVKLDSASAKRLERFVSRLVDAEKLLLPRRKRVALNQMMGVLSEFRKQAFASRDQELGERYQSITELLGARGSQWNLDWDAIATFWIDVVRPTWFKKLMEPRRRRPAKLQDLRKDLLAAEEELRPHLLKFFDDPPSAPPLEERVSVCIVGLSVK